MTTYITQSISVPTPLVEAFAYTADFSNLADWDPGVASSRRLDAGELEVGSRFDVIALFGRSEIPMVYTITELDSPHRVVLVGEGEKLTATDTISFAEDGNGTRIDYIAELEFRNFIRFVEPFMGRVFDRVGRKAMVGLEAALGDRNSRP